MWKIAKLEETGFWSDVNSFNSIEECKDYTSGLSGSTEDLFYFYDGEIPSDKALQNEIHTTVFAANEDRVLRITIGLEVRNSDNKDQITSCSGSCICVVYTNGVRQCETYYCGRWGHCYYVRCGSSTC